MRLILAAGILSFVLAGPVSSQESGDDLIGEFLATLGPVQQRPALVSAEIQVVGCPSDGQMGFISAPDLPPRQRLTLPEGVAPYLTFYSADPGLKGGVLAPRGWSCRRTSGSSGFTLAVVPPGAVSDEVGQFPRGPAVIRRVAEGGTSGRFEVARFAARLFPQIRTFVNQVRGEDPSSWNDYVFSPWPDDRIVYLSSTAVGFATPPGRLGLGRDRLDYAPNEMVRGLIFLNDPDSVDLSLSRLSVRLGVGQDWLYPAIAIAFLESKTTSTPQGDLSVPALGGDSVPDVVRAFYEALGRADGRAASERVVPERRATGPLSATAITKFFSRLPERLIVRSVEPVAPDRTRVLYRYRKPGGVLCEGDAIVETVDAPRGPLIARIRPLNGC